MGVPLDNINPTRHRLDVTVVRPGNINPIPTKSPAPLVRQVSIKDQRVKQDVETVQPVSIVPLVPVVALDVHLVNTRDRLVRRDVATVQRVNLVPLVPVVALDVLQVNTKDPVVRGPVVFAQPASIRLPHHRRGDVTLVRPDNINLSLLKAVATPVQQDNIKDPLDKLCAALVHLVNLVPLVLLAVRTVPQDGIKGLRVRVHAVRVQQVRTAHQALYPVRIVLLVSTVQPELLAV